MDNEAYKYYSKDDLVDMLETKEAHLRKLAGQLRGQFIRYSKLVKQLKRIDKKVAEARNDTQ